MMYTFMAAAAADPQFPTQVVLATAYRWHNWYKACSELTMPAAGGTMPSVKPPKFTAILDANGDASNFEAGPGIDFTLPIFNQGQGAKAIADAKFQKAITHYTAVRDQIALEVRQALIRYRQAEKDL